MNRHKRLDALIAAALLAPASTAACTLLPTPATSADSPSGLLQGFEFVVVEPA